MSQFNIKGSNFIKNAFVNALRFAFANVTDFENYRYSADERLNKIQIYKEFPRRLFKPPTIVVKAGPADASINYLTDNEFESEEKTGGIVTKTIAQGKLETPIIISVYGMTTDDREVITDLATFFVRHLFREKFAEFGIAYTQIRQGGEGQIDWDNQVIYSNTITVDCYQEYINEVDVGLSETIGSLDITCEVKDLLDP